MAKQDTTKIICTGSMVQNATAFVKANEVFKAAEKQVAPAKKALNEGVADLFMKDLDHVRPDIFTCYKVDEVNKIDAGEGVLVEIPSGRVASVVAKFAKQEVSVDDSDAFLKSLGRPVYDKLLVEEEVYTECGLTDALDFARQNPTACTVSVGSGGVSIGIRGNIPGTKSVIKVFTAPDFLETVREMDAEVRKPVLAMLKKIIKAGTSFAVGAGTREIET